MDDLNRFARDMAEAIAAAVADHPKVAACRERARAAGYQIKLSLEATIGFASRDETGGADKTVPPARALPLHEYEVSTADRKFLRSLRIAADETAEEVDN